MRKVLITGSTGNIGKAVIKYLNTAVVQPVAAVRNIDNAKTIFKSFPNLQYALFDFELPETYSKALFEIDILFLLRPPHISDVVNIFQPLLKNAVAAGVTKVVFISVQGVERSSIIPHHKIERLIRETGMDYVFLRPSYFMQNLTTTLLSDIVKHKEIILPAGKAKFNWIDVENIGEVTARVIEAFDKYKNQAFDLTGTENAHFDAVAALMRKTLSLEIENINLNPITFYFRKSKEGMPKGMILVLIMLHFLPRFQAEPKLSSFVYNVTGKPPTTLKTFLLRERDHFTKSE